MTNLEQLYDTHARALHGVLLNDVSRDLPQAVFLKVAQQPDLLASRRPRSSRLSAALGVSWLAPIGLVAKPLVVVAMISSRTHVLVEER